MDLDTAEDALDIDLDSFAQTGTVTGGVPQTEPLILVCTHGRHDACCSIRGNQVSRIACGLPDTDAWECSHIGGDRFAANVVCFPHGIYYGRVGPDDVVPLINSYSANTLALEHYRGRCCYPFAVQSAEYFAREARSLAGIDDLIYEGSRRDGDRLGATFLLSGGERLRVHVRVHHSHDHHRLTCRSEMARAIPRYELESVETLSE